ncbi:MAG: hypothetical protein JRI44_09535 [Deltaproteobacteria bacterium]|nr:hypothetical protein [Deltaproteobacteria bacterium]
MLINKKIKFNKFHHHATKNNQLAQMLENLLVHYLRFYLSIPREIEYQSSFLETKKIIQSIKSKDEPNLRIASEEHIRKSADEIMGSF